MEEKTYLEKLEDLKKAIEQEQKRLTEKTNSQIKFALLIETINLTEQLRKSLDMKIIKGLFKGSGVSNNIRDIQNISANLHQIIDLEAGVGDLRQVLIKNLTDEEIKRMKKTAESIKKVPKKNKIDYFKALKKAKNKELGNPEPTSQSKR